MEHSFNSAPTRRFATALVVLLVTALSGIFGAASATAAPSAASVEPPAIDPLVVITDNRGTEIAEFQLSQATPEQATLLEELAAKPSTSVVKRPGAPGVVTPMITPGFGVFIYLYLNTDDYDAIIGGSKAFVATALCSGGGGLAIAVCNTIADMLAAKIKGKVPPRGYCLETRFSYPLVNGSSSIRFEGAKMVKRSC